MCDNQDHKKRRCVYTSNNEASLSAQDKTITITNNYNCNQYSSDFDVERVELLDRVEIMEIKIFSQHKRYKRAIEQVEILQTMYTKVVDHMGTMQKRQNEMMALITTLQEEKAQQQMIDLNDEVIDEQELTDYLDELMNDQPNYHMMNAFIDEMINDQTNEYIFN
jgi:hypothetical protein